VFFIRNKLVGLEQLFYFWLECPFKPCTAFEVLIPDCGAKLVQREMLMLDD